MCLGRERFIWLTGCIPSGWEAGRTEAQSMGDTRFYWLVPAVRLGYLSYMARAHRPSTVSTHWGPNTPTSIDTQENIPRARPHANQMEAISQGMFPLPRCRELTTKLYHQTCKLSGIYSKYHLVFFKRRFLCVCVIASNMKVSTGRW